MTAAIEAVWEIEQQIKVLQKHAAVVMLEGIKNCPHPGDAIREANHYPFYLGGSLPPFRVCTLCGYAEDGWGCGYWRLNNNYQPVAMMDRDYLQREYVRHRLDQNELSDLRYRQRTGT